MFGRWLAMVAIEWVLDFKTLLIALASLPPTTDLLLFYHGHFSHHEDDLLFKPPHFYKKIKEKEIEREKYILTNNLNTIQKKNNELGGVINTNFIQIQIKLNLNTFCLRITATATFKFCFLFLNWIWNTVSPSCKINLQWDLISKVWNDIDFCIDNGYLDYFYILLRFFENYLIKRNSIYGW